MRPQKYSPANRRPSEVVSDNSDPADLEWPAFEDLSVQPETEAEAWCWRADELAEAVDRVLVVRHDAYGYYVPPKKRVKDKRYVFRSKYPLSRGNIKRHFLAKRIIGLYTTVRIRGRCFSKWLLIDIDRHEGDTIHPATTRQAAIALYERAKDLGLEPLLSDSSGTGGYHLLLVFNELLPTEKAYAVGQWLLRDYRELGLSKKPETFPKQDRLKPEEKFGNWARLPGHHHTHEHYSRFWNGSEWLAGSLAVDWFLSILSTGGSPAGAIPTEALASSAEAKPAAQPGTTGAAKSGSGRRRVDDAREKRLSANPIRCPERAWAIAGSPLGDSDKIKQPSMVAKIMKRLQITGQSQRHIKMGQGVGILRRLDCSKELTYAVMMDWWKHGKPGGFIKADEHEMSADLISSIDHTWADPAFAPGGKDWHAREKASILLSQQTPSQIMGITGTGGQKLRKPRGGEKRREGEESNTCIGLGNSRFSGANLTLDYIYIESLLRHAIHEISLKGPSPFVAATDDQIAEVALLVFGRRLNSDQLRRMKIRYVSQVDRPATHVELLCETRHGKPGRSGQPGTPSEYKITGLLALLETQTPSQSIASTQELQSQ